MRPSLTAALPDNQLNSFPGAGEPHYESQTDSRTRLTPVADPELDYRDDFEQLCETRYDSEHGALWLYLKPSTPAHFTPQLVSALRQGQLDIESKIREHLSTGRRDRLRYQVSLSRIPGVFSLGGDLQLLSTLIRTQRRDALLKYAQNCIDLVYTNAINYGLPVTTISLVQGQALGGGFEAALAANVVIAERQATFAFPEVLFNLFPGMGAYQLLSRRISPAKAERLILSGSTYTAEQLYDMGVVDVLADDGQGEQAVLRFIKGNHRQFHARQAFRRAVQAAEPLSYDSLARVTEVWVDAALGISDRDLGVIDYLIQAQAKLNRRRDLENMDEVDLEAQCSM